MLIKILVGGTVTIGQSAAQALGINWMVNVIVKKVNIQVCLSVGV